MTKQIGPFEVRFWSGGYPVWCFIKYMNKEFQISHNDLQDLKYAVEDLIRSAKASLPDQYKDEA